MFKLLLILKYLRRKLAPMFAALAVTLCTMMVIIVISVMGGFLELLRESAHRLTGDVVVTAYSLTGFPHYEPMMRDLEELPEIAAAAPIIDSYGLIQIGQRTIPVQLQGIVPAKLDQVVAYRQTLQWTTEDYLAYFDSLFPPEAQRTDAERELIEERRAAWREIDPIEYGMTLEPPAIWQPDPDRELPGVVLGIELSPTQQRDEEGDYHLRNSAVGEEVNITVVPLSERGTLGAFEPRYPAFIVVNEFKSGLYEIDANRAYVPFEVLQRNLEMHAEQVWADFDPETGEPIGEPVRRPARATQIVIAAAPGYTVEQAQAAAARVANRYMEQYPDMPMLDALTWEQQHEGLLNAVRNEKGLVTFLFAIISLVAIVMVATTFYMIVLEKTRDIGVLRAIGASRRGIAHVFLGYGLAIGVVGSGIGLALAVAIVTHLNEIQAVVYDWTGWRMWDPRTYFFDRIPDRVDPVEAGWIVVGAILSSVLGALIPALLAARLDPVEALRYE